VLRIAREFGRPPEEVEKWDEYWLNRTVEWLDGEAIAQRQEEEANGRKRR
jgi:hypothetical protein